MKKLGKFLIVSVIAYMAMIILSTSVIAVESTDLELKNQYSESYEKWLELSDEEKENVAMPNMFDIPYYTTSNGFGDSIFAKQYQKMVKATVSETSRYRLDEDGVEVRVKDQGYTNECWAFTLTSVLETTCSKTATTLAGKEFSPRHMDYATMNVYSDVTLTEDTWIREPGQGGNFRTGLSYITRGDGPVYESEMPTKVNSKETTIASTELDGFTTRATVKEAVFFPSIYKKRSGDTFTYYSTMSSSGSTLLAETTEEAERLVEENRNNIKEHIMTYGAVAAQMCGEINPYFNTTTKAYNSTSLSVGHAVTIVGWDDNYSAANFPVDYQPTTDGAWIVLQSYGTEDTGVHSGMKTIVGDGFFYVSYEDSLIESGINGIREVTEVDYDYLYQYDPIGYTGYAELESGSKARVTYTKQSENIENIKEIGIYLLDEMYVTVLYTDSDEENVEIIPQTLAHPGYTALKLTEDRLIDDEEFKIIVKYEGKATVEASEEEISESTTVEQIRIPIEATTSQAYATASGKSATGKKIATSGFSFENWYAVDQFDYCIKVFAENVNEEEVVPTELNIQQDYEKIEIGGYVQLSTEITPSYANTQREISWTSSDEKIATVSDNGLVKGIAVGTVTITAKTENDKSDTCTITVVEPDIEVTKVTLNESILELTQEETYNLIAVISPDNATDKTVTWETSDSNVATVSDIGLVTAVAPGTATITVVTTNNKKATCTVKVKEIEVSEINLNKTSMEITQGETETLIATILPDNAANKTVTWTSSSEDIATVSSNGSVTAILPGETIITASSNNGKTATCTVIVNPIEVESVTLNKSELKLKVGKYETLSATVLPSNATYKTVTWTSSDETVATVNSNGLVNAIKEGNTIITAKCSNGKLATCTVTVSAIEVESVILNKSILTLVEGNSDNLTAAILPVNATNKIVAWSTSDESVAQVTTVGQVTAIAPGTAVITATSNNGKTATCKVTVSAAVVAVESIFLSETSGEIIKGSNVSLTATILPYNATNKTVTWKTNNTSVATVDSSGKVLGVDCGTATITASTNNGKTATYTVTVIPDPTKPTSINTDVENVEIIEGLKMQLTATVEPSTASQEVIWSSSNNAVATVSNTGLVQGITVGNAVITVKSTIDETILKTINVVINKKQIVKVEIKQIPSKVQYIQNYENIDLTDGILLVTYDNGTTEEIPMTSNKVSISGFDNSVIETKVITVEYDEYNSETLTYDVEIIAAEISEITIGKSPTKTIYVKGIDEIDLSGGTLVVSYTDETDKVVNMVDTTLISHEVKEEEGIYKLYVTLQYENKQITISYEIQYKEIDTVVINKLPNKTVYYLNEELDLTGGELLVTYTDGSTLIVSMEDSNCIVSKFDSATTGEKTVEVTYYKLATFTVEVTNQNAGIVSRIEMSSLPTKQEYIKNQDELDLTGGQILVKYLDGTSEYKNLTDENVVISGFDNTALGENAITVKYLGKETVFIVKIVNDYEVSELILTLPSKLEYIVIEDTELDLTGGSLTIKYVNGAPDKILSLDDESVSVTGYDSSTVGTQTITVAYNGKTTTFNIVVRKIVSSVEIANLPEKLEYEIGDTSLDLSGGQLLVTYNDGSKVNISMMDSRVTTSGFDGTIVGIQIITISFENKTTTFNVVVSIGIQSISLQTEPTKKEYIQSKEELDLTGGVILVTYTNGNTTTIELPSDKVEVSQFDNTKLGEQIITITYKGHVVEYTVNVIEEVVVEKVLEKIEVKTVPNKLTYIQNKESIDLEGGVITATYTDKTREEISMEDARVIVLGFNNTTLGPRTITVGFGGKYATFEVTIISEIVEKVVDKIEIATLPSKVEYVINADLLDLTGGTIKVTYTDATTEILNMTDEGVSVSGFDNTVVGTKVITVTYEEKTTVFEVEVIAAGNGETEKTITSISVTKSPSKLIYVIGETLDLNGGEITAKYSDGTTEIIPMTDEKVRVTGFDSSVAKVQTLTVNYENKLTTFIVTIMEKEIEVKVEKIQMKILPTKQKYVLGEELELAGAEVLVTYTDKTTKTIKLPDSDVKVSGFDNEKLGVQIVTVNYEDKLTTFTVSVVEKVEEGKKVTKIQISKMPDKVKYTKGEALDLSGGKIKVIYDDGSKEEISMTEDGVSVLGFNTFKVGTQIVTISYAGKSTTMNLIVKEETNDDEEDEEKDNSDSDDEEYDDSKEIEDEKEYESDVEENKKQEQKQDEEEQKAIDTGDNIKLYIAFLIISLSIIIVSSIKIKKA